MVKISAYQVETIQKNIIKGIVRMSVANGEVRYDTHELKPKKRLNISDVVKIVKIVKRAEKFFLYKRNFLLEPQKILFDKKNQPRLIYIPIKEHESRSINIEALIRSAIGIPFICSNIISFYNSEEESYAKFNKFRILHISAALILSLLAALFIDLFMIAVLPAFIAAPYIKVGKNNKKPLLAGDDRTVVLSQRPKVSVCFSDVFGNEKSICINEHEQAYIGRDKKECLLYVGNNAVGRKHAKMTFADGRIYISDNDSLNNTYVNNQKLKKQKQYEVKNGDRLRFADEEYMLFIP